MKAHPLAGIIAGAARLISGVNARWVDSEPDPRQTVYFANHTSHLDFVVLWSSLPAEIRARTRPVAAQDYWDKGLRRAIAVNVFRAVLVARHQVGQGGQAASADPKQAIEHMLDAMGSDNSLILFPEGTRGTGEEVAAFKSGLYYLCQRKPELRLVPSYPEQSKPHSSQGRVSAGAVHQPAHVRAGPGSRTGRTESPIPGAGALGAVPFERDMKNLDPQLVWAFAGVLGLLALSSLIGLVLKASIKKPEAQATISNLNARIGAWWIMSAIFALTLVIGLIGSLVLFGLMSFLALREYVTLLPTRRADHRTLFWAFFIFTPLQYFLIAIQWYGMFAILIP